MRWWYILLNILFDVFFLLLSNFIAKIIALCYYTICLKNNKLKDFFNVKFAIPSNRASISYLAL